jgi:hypothetical protein
LETAVSRDDRPGPTTISLPESQDQYDITIKSPETADERQARLERETLELRHRLDRELLITCLAVTLVSLGFIYCLVVLVWPGVSVEARTFAERALIGLVTGLTGYLVGRRAGV